MYWLKSCPKCHGDLFDNKDIYGSYMDCLQCGHYLTVDEEAGVRLGSPYGRTHALPPERTVRVLTEIAA